MAYTACTIKHITLMTIANGCKYQGGIDSDGLELPDVQIIADFGLPEQRTYICNNCGRSWDGSETFEPVKKHFGIFPID